MALIRREAAIEALGEEPLRWNNTITEGQEWNDWKYHVDAIKSVPTVPAVPLDKLCEWLARNAFAFECEDCEEYCRALLGCEHEVGSDPEYWKNKLTKWMDEQDADREWRFAFSD